MKMWINLLQIISFSCLLGVAYGCKTASKDISSTTRLQFDTLFVGPQAYGKTPSGMLLPDSLAEIYRAKASKFEPFPTLDSNESGYKAFQQAFFSLDKTTFGKIIHFEPADNAYSSSQLFIEKEDGIHEDGLELAYSYGEEGIIGTGSSYVIKTDDRVKIFTKKDWVVFEYYMPDEREDTDLVLDTLMAFEYKGESLVPMQLDSIKKVEVGGMFE